MDSELPQTTDPIEGCRGTLRPGCLGLATCVDSSGGSSDSSGGTSGLPMTCHTITLTGPSGCQFTVAAAAKPRGAVAGSKPGGTIEACETLEVVVS